MSAPGPLESSLYNALARTLTPGAEVTLALLCALLTLPWRPAAQVEEDPESDVARTDPWEVFGFRLHPGEEVVCRVHQARMCSLASYCNDVELAV